MARARAPRNDGDPSQIDRAFPDQEDADPIETDRLLGDAVELDDPYFQDATWNVYRLADDGTPLPGPGIGRFVRKMVGRLDQEKLLAALGGGCFRLVARLPDRTRKMLIVSLEGPALASPGAPSSLVSGPTGVASDGIAQLRAELAELRRMLSQPVVTSANPIEIAKMFSEQFTAGLTFARTLMPAPQPASESAVQAMLGMWERGFKTGERSEGGSSLGDTVKEMLPQILSLLPRPAPPQPIARVQPVAVPAATSPANAPAPIGARVGVDVSQLAEDRRVLMLTEILANAIKQEREPDDLVDVVEGVLTDDELADLERATPAMLLARIGPGLAEQYPVLTSSEAVPYLERFLAVLRDHSGDDTAAG